MVAFGHGWRPNSHERVHNTHFSNRSKIRAKRHFDRKTGMGVEAAIPTDVADEVQVSDLRRVVSVNADVETISRENVVEFQVLIGQG